MTFEQLVQKVAALEKEMKTSKDTRSISREQETALRHRLKVLTASSNATDTFTSANITQTLNLTGNAQNIDVLEFPAGYIPILFQGQTYKVPYWLD